ncbi:right-handed parallel beta-helix repeat-containing protein [Psychroserpens damuponensis]|uniref:right-handed parallel beta-helix repeat-containing protein n=1 Tax=Psychroserpens damuponensis TaxID=943936 RepID=UPI00058BDBEE|nr:right-handed parallel beta-helix repeat-containing protein [Psychroserpens damuponensis]
MLRKTLYVLCYFVGLLVNAQQEFHVFPKDDANSPGTSLGNGSLAQPWDLQTALSQTTDIVNSGDTIWIHEGVYTGKFATSLQSLEPNQYITVSGFNDDKVILNGNVKSPKKSVLEIKSQQVIFQNFEVTFLGEYARHVKDKGFIRADGINHMSGQDCKFINLIIHNNPGSGFGSWKHTGGTQIYGCKIYNNGFFSEVRGRGAGIYVQNLSDKTRVIKNNIIFNNYYMGIEVWSASTKATSSYVKNMLLENNTVFNNGSSGGYYKNNIIVATDDTNGINRATNIKLINNILFHNIDVAKSAKGDAGSLTLGINKKAPLLDVVVTDNIIIGGNNALRFDNAENTVFKHNTIYGGYVHFYEHGLSNVETLDFNNNAYFSKNNRNFRVINKRDYTMADWKSSLSIDANSTWQNIKSFEMKSILNISKNEFAQNEYRVSLFQKEGKPVIVDFSEYHLKTGTTFKIYDVENPKIVLKSGVLQNNGNIVFPMNNLNFEKPLHNTKAQKTVSNFGVFIVEFEHSIPSEISTDQKDNALKRFFKWLGF